MNFLKKRAASTVALVATAAVALTGCSRGEGEPEPAANSAEMRVASLGLGDADTLLALGITPVAVAPWGAKGDIGPSGVGPWSEHLLGDADPVAIYNSASGFTADILEQVSAVDPTHIVAVNQAVDVEAQDSLENIAPTTLAPEEFDDWQVPWEDQVTAIAEGVGKGSEGQELIKQTQQVFEDFRRDHPEVQGARAAIVMPYDGKIGLYTAEDGRGQFVEDLGFDIPDELQGDGSTFFVDYAPENYTELNNVDYLFVLDYNGLVDQIKNDPTFKNLDVVRDGRVHYLDTDTGSAMSMPNPVTIPWVAERFEEQL